MMKLNCWEFKRCGREPGGVNAGAQGVCPAATDSRLQGIHEGINGGRACWVVAGTMCDGKTQGIFAQKYEDCRICDFYHEVKREEDKEFLITIDLIRMLEY